MGSPAGNVVTGSCVGTGADMNIRTVGFRPKRVVLNVGGLDAAWQKTMADDSMYKRLANGTGSLVTTNGITPLSDGFSLGADTDINAAGAIIHYTVFAE